MPSLKHIKRRITTVSTTRQVMKAMDMVATSKLARTRNQMLAARPMVTEAWQIMDGLRGADSAQESIYMKPRPVENTAYIVVAGDRGLCGSYNHNISQRAVGHMLQQGNEKVISIGLKGRDLLRRRGRNIINVSASPSEETFYTEANRVASMLISMYKSGEVDEVYMAYTHFETVMSHEPVIVRLLPFEAKAEPGSGYNWMTFELGFDYFMEYAINMFLSAFIYGALLEASTSEQASRMVNMNAAVKNATGIIDNLTLAYNRQRQAVITQEISEIINGITVTA